jgi:hypothetical protein
MQVALLLEANVYLPVINLLGLPHGGDKAEKGR